MRTHVFLLVVLALISIPAFADEPAIVDRSTTAPQLLEVSEIDIKGKTVKIEVFEYRPVFVRMDKTVIEGGVPKVITETRVELVPEQRTKLLAFKQLRAVYPSGKEVAAEKIAAIEKATPVILSTDPTGSISQRFVKLLADDAILLLAEREPPAEVPPMP